MQVLKHQIEDIWDQHNDMVLLKHQIEDQLTAISRFEDLYDKKYVDKENLTPMEETKLTIYQNMFGKKPPVYTGQEMLDNFIKKRDFLHYQLWTNHEIMRNTKEMIPISLNFAVKDLYVNIVNLEDTLDNQSLYTDILKSKYESANLKYELGQISEFELLNEKNNYLIQKLSEETIQRQIEIMRLNLKKLIGVDLHDNITLSSNVYGFGKMDLKSISFYENRAIENRIEVINAKLTYEMEKREADIVKEYLSNPLLTDRLTYDSDEIDAKNTSDRVILDVKEDVTKAYFEVEESYEDYNLKIDDLLKAKADLDAKKMMYENGIIDKTTFEMIEFAYNMAKDSFVSSKRTLNLNYEKLENISNFGLEATSNGGE